MEKIEVLFLSIDGFEASSLASLPALQSKSGREDQNISVLEDWAP